MSNTYFNKNRYFNLLQLEKALELEYNDSSLNDSEFQELLGYRIILRNQIIYPSKTQFTDHQKNKNLT